MFDFLGEVLLMGFLIEMSIGLDGFGVWILAQDDERRGGFFFLRGE